MASPFIPDVLIWGWDLGEYGLVELRRAQIIIDSNDERHRYTINLC